LGKSPIARKAVGDEKYIYKKNSGIKRYQGVNLWKKLKSSWNLFPIIWKIWWISPDEGLLLEPPRRPNLIERFSFSFGQGPLGRARRQ
jgi:hypothetical protein